MRRVAVGALILLLAAACSRSGPTLADATKLMVKDGTELMASQYMEHKKVIDQGGDGGDDPVGCPDGTSRRTYQATGDFGKVDGTTSAELADLAAKPMRSSLRVLGYELDRSVSSVSDPAQSIGAFRKKDPGITLTLIVQAAFPNIKVSAKTDCLRVS